jgi:hypothetical protein
VGIQETSKATDLLADVVPLLGNDDDSTVRPPLGHVGDMKTTEVALVRGEKNTALGCSDCEMCVVGACAHPGLVRRNHIELECTESADNTARGRVLI